jgi:hypothetical protein
LVSLVPAALDAFDPHPPASSTTIASPSEGWGVDPGNDVAVDYPPPIPDPATDPIRRFVIVTQEPECPRYMDLLHGDLARPDAQENTAALHALRHDAQHISDEVLRHL